MADDVTATLAEVAGALPGGGEAREGQAQMAVAVGSAMTTGRHLVVQAGTGTGKSLAYLIPAALDGQRIVVATATKALQDQLADNDLPLVAGAVGHDFSFAVLKGPQQLPVPPAGLRGRGAGRAALAPTRHRDPPDADDPDQRARRGRRGCRGPGSAGEQVRRLVDWSQHTVTGDRAELEFEPHARAWAMVSTTARECPGAFRCPSGGTASPRTPGPAPPRPTWWWSTPTCTAPIWPAGGPCSLPTRWWCSTRPTRSRR